MSSGGAGGGDSTDGTTDDGTDGAGSNTTDGGTDGTSDDGGGDGLSASAVREIAETVLFGWIRSLPRVVRKFFERPVAVVLSIVVGFVWYDLIRPILVGIWQAGLALIGGILTLGQSIVAVGDLLIGALVGGFAPVGATLLRTIGQFNRAIAQAAATGGLAAPTIVTLLWGVQLGVAGYLAVSLIESIDVPFVDLGGILRAVTAPVKFVVGIIR